MDRDKRQKFIDLAERRVNKTVHQMKLIGNLGNHNLYTSTKEEQEQIEKYLFEKLEFHIKRLKKGKPNDFGFNFGEGDQLPQKGEE